MTFILKPNSPFKWQVEHQLAETVWRKEYRDKFIGETKIVDGTYSVAGMFHGKKSVEEWQEKIVRDQNQEYEGRIESEQKFFQALPFIRNFETFLQGHYLDGTIGLVSIIYS